MSYTNEESSLYCDITSEEDNIELRGIYVLKVKNLKENTLEEIMSSYRVNPG